MKKILLYVLLMHRCSSIITASAQTIDDPKTDPCHPFKPQIQNFTTSGRRINQVKCFEYILDFKNREGESDQKKECELKRQSEGLGTASRLIDYNQGEYPHMGALGWRLKRDKNLNKIQDEWSFKCGGSLISSKFVLTAAHCASTLPSDTTVEEKEPKIVRFGVKNLKRRKRVRRVLAIHPDPVDIQILRLIVHPEYKPPLRYNDIALLELANDVKFTMLVQPACLWNSEDVRSVQTKATVSGWGITDLVSQTQPAELQITALNLIDSNLCDNLLIKSRNRNWKGLKTSQICAGVLEGGIDTCQGDSGGPLQTKIELPLKRSAMHYVIGITSFGVGCGLANRPGVYTRVSSFVDWIEEVVWPTKQ